MSTHNLWILFLMFGASLVSWVFNHLREQAKRRSAKEEARRQYEEHLRTGRVSEPARPTAPVQVAPLPSELAERRQAQLRDLRRQQEAARGGPTVLVAKAPSAPAGRGGRAVPPTIVLGPGGVVIQRGPVQPRTSGAPVRVQTPGVGVPTGGSSADPRVEFQQRRLREQAEREAAALRAEHTEQALVVEEARKRSVATASGASPVLAGRRGGLDVRALLTGRGGVVQRRADLRRLMAINEILSPPLSLRD